MDINIQNLSIEDRVGYCMCGCGGQTQLARRSIKPNKFIHGHQNRCRVKYKETSTGCWEWQTGAAPSGYGVARVNGRSVRAHRAVYEALVGPIPEGMVLDHGCRNKICVNPSHLQPVTVAENTRRGKSAKLRQSDVLNMRELASQGVSQAALCGLYKLSRSTVCRIIGGEAWSDV